MNRDALTLPAEKIVDALLERVDSKRKILEKRDLELGADRVLINSYMENIGWPELFGYDMNDFFADPDLAFDLQLRQQLFWADNSNDDAPLDLTINSDTGVYYDMTLFGEKIRHTANGVPEFEPHAISDVPDLSTIEPFDFYSTGDMPAVIDRYKRMCEISNAQCGISTQVGFPAFHRGPLDIYVQLRGYENFIADTMEQPDLVHEFLNFFADARFRYRTEREKFLGDAGQTDAPRVADDWVNIPFISPGIFHEFVVPAYQRVVKNEGPVLKFHTCGAMEPVVCELLDVFPGIARLDVSGWNDVAVLDEIVPPHVAFDVSLINTFTLCAPEAEQRRKFEAIAAVASHRNVTVCAQAIVKLLPTYEETLARMNATIELARATFAAARPAKDPQH